ncbi:hypothetical protein O181_005997 [Austropuccinia psidii MF-1]|uniref:Uncharacterized protein n=1 Tax=Austropuccinia psidii MF-1 TaxID=1389203 RepID=A0A9Q3BJ71_9BASI|nr:hypothetical protein [Austropuccinia psidii MF-1]
MLIIPTNVFTLTRPLSIILISQTAWVLTTPRNWKRAIDRNNWVGATTANVRNEAFSPTALNETDLSSTTSSETFNRNVNSRAMFAVLTGAGMIGLVLAILFVVFCTQKAKIRTSETILAVGPSVLNNASKEKVKTAPKTGTTQNILQDEGNQNTRVFEISRAFQNASAHSKTESINSDTPFHELITPSSSPDKSFCWGPEEGNAKFHELSEQFHGEMYEVPHIRRYSPPETTPPQITQLSNNLSRSKTPLNSGEKWIREEALIFKRRSKSLPEKSPQRSLVDTSLRKVEEDPGDEEYFWIKRRSPSIVPTPPSYMKNSGVELEFNKVPCLTVVSDRLENEILDDASENGRGESYYWKSPPRR